ncbi:hypothetical protein N9D86_01900 [Gammaproteobacteria bacterium]|nr:hypothetical protein [Gammaproteobacteria bacterium]
MSSKEKKRILIVISNDLYIRNYLTTSALNALKKKFELSFLISNEVKSLSEIEHIEYSTYIISQSRHKTYYKVFDLLMWHYRSKSKTFRFRIKRVQGLDLSFEEETSLHLKFIKSIFRILRSLYLFIKNIFLANSFILPIYLFFINLKLGVNKPLIQRLESFCPDMVLFPSSAYDPEGTDLIKICKSKKIPSVFLIDNWDNLSSKSIFWDLPSYIGVWGAQSKEHAKSIQGFQDKNVFLLGTPRYDNYFSERKMLLESPYSFKYILFVGTALVFDEPAVLVKLNKIIQKNALLHGIKIIYRPHPWRQTKKIFELEGLEYVIIDTQLEDAYKTGKRDVSLQPSLSYYPSLLNNAEFVVGGLTSMMIEALIFHKRFLGLIHDDKKHFTSMHNVYENYTHFEGIDKIDAVTLCANLDDLEECLIKVLDSKDALSPQLIDEQRKYFYHHDNLLYQDRLLKMCEEIL